MKGLIVIFIVLNSILHSSVTNATNENNLAEIAQSKESINSDIKALSEKGKIAQQAANRLIARDKSVLNQLHAALNNNDYPLRHKTIIAIVIGSFEDKSSIQPLILLSTSNPDDANLNSTIIRILTIFPRSDEIDNFIVSKLNDNATSKRVLQYSLKLLAKHPANKDKKWAEKYSSKDYDLGTRSLAMYLGGILRIDSFKEKIINTLLHRNKKTGEKYMLIGLSYLTTPDEFDTIAKTDGIHLDSKNIILARHHYYLKNGTSEQKREAASMIIHGNSLMLKNDAINYFIQTNDAEGLAHAWLNNDKLVRHVLIQAGLTINFGNDKTEFIKQPKKNYFYDKNKGRPTSTVLKAKKDKLARSIFRSFQTNDKGKFESTALATKIQINIYLATLAPVHAYKRGMLKSHKDQIIKSQESILSSWDVIFSNGIDNHIDWSSAKYVASNDDNRQLNDLEFLITYKGYYYSIQLHELTMYGNVLRLSSSLRWNSKPLSSHKYLKWSTLAENNNDLIHAHELKLLSNATKSGNISILRMRATYQNVIDQYNLYALLNISTNQDDKNEALNWLRSAASNNYAKAQYQLSEDLMSDWHKSQSTKVLQEATSNLINAAHQNYIFALNRIAEHHSHGSAGFDFDLSIAIEYFQRLLDLEPSSLDKDNQYAYYSFRANISDRVNLLQEQKQGLDANDPELLTEFAILQLNNKTIKSKTNGASMLKHAAELNHPEAQYQLGKIYLSGNEVIQKNINTAIELLNNASSSNHINATKDLAYVFINGEYGIDKNPHKAIVLADKLANLYQKTEADYKFSDSIRIWRVHACNLDIEIKRKNDPSFVIPRVMTGRCAGL